MRQGTTPDAIALSVALGFVLGLFPLFGLPTLLCAAAAAALRLNAPAIQAVNYLVYPLQLALLAPFAQLGSRLFGHSGKMATPHVTALLHAGLGRVIQSLGGLAAHAIVGWFCISVPAGLLLYLALARTLRRRSGRMPAPSSVD